MAEAKDGYLKIHKNGTATLMARVVGADGSNITQSDITSAKYSIYLLDDQDPDSRTAVSGHSAVDLTVSAVIFKSLQTDSLWDQDGTGYNFRHTPDIGSHQAFTIAGRNYLIEYTLTPASGQEIVVRFRGEGI